MAGLWKSDLIIELCWSTIAIGAFKPLSYQAPSWSSASVKGSRIYLPHRLSHITYRFCARTLDYDITTLDPDSFGEVRGGILRLMCGSLLCGVLQELSRIQSKFIFEDVTFPIGHLDVHREEGALVYFLPLYFGANGLSGIIIQPTELEPGQFRRIGDFAVQSTHGREFTRAMKTPSCLASESVYASIVEVNEYVEDLEVLKVIGHGEELYLFTNKQYIITLI